MRKIVSLLLFLGAPAFAKEPTHISPPGEAFGFKPDTDLFGFRPQYHAQSKVTYKLLFDGLLYSSSEVTSPGAALASDHAFAADTSARKGGE